jgi:hypothetical protein
MAFERSGAPFDSAARARRLKDQVRSELAVAFFNSPRFAASGQPGSQPGGRVSPAGIGFQTCLSNAMRLWMIG